jgi:hypothetical protein
MLFPPHHDIKIRMTANTTDVTNTTLNQLYNILIVDTLNAGAQAILVLSTSHVS